MAIGADQTGLIPRSCDARAARPDDQACSITDVVHRRVEHTFAEGAGEALLGTKQDKTTLGSPAQRCSAKSGGSRLNARPMVREITSV